MRSKVKIGVVCLARESFDVSAARELYEQQKKKLQAMEDVEWIFCEDVVISVEEGEAAASVLAAATVDGVVIISGTFHLGHLALIIDRALHKPILLWAFNELPYNGGKIRLNSVCGINLNASNLYKSQNDCFDCVVGDDIDQDWVSALRIRTAISTAHVGVAGYRAHGFFNLSVEDLSLYRTLGTLIDHYELEELHNGRENRFDVEALFDCSGVTDRQVELTGQLATSMEDFLRKNKIDALAVRCWPEFANTYGVAPCGAMSILNARGYTLSCEGDVEGAISLLAAKILSKEPAFFADLSQVDIKNNFALMWHCGVAPESLWDGKSRKTLDTYFAGGRGVTADFVLKEGPVTIFRIDTARGKTRLFLEKGTAVETEQELRGTYVKVVFPITITELLDKVTSTGVAHHVVMVYGDHVRVLKKYAKMMGFEVIE